MEANAAVIVVLPWLDEGAANISAGQRTLVIDYNSYNKW
ncbi:hypothetical protein PE36_05473 [Moritella sp. PE36]|nr:hypothetical protein PE36_05473 [Moritella sp. PE36]